MISDCLNDAAHVFVFCFILCHNMLFCRITDGSGHLSRALLCPQICLTGCSRDLMVRIDQLCSQHSIKVFCGDVYGYYGYMFCNLGQDYKYIE